MDFPKYIVSNQKEVSIGIQGLILILVCALAKIIRFTTYSSCLYANSECYGETVWVRRIVWAPAARLRGKWIYY